MNALNTSLTAVHVPAFDCSGLSDDIRKGVEAMLQPIHRRQLGLAVSQHLLNKASGMTDLTFRQRSKSFCLMFSHKNNGSIGVHEFTAGMAVPAFAAGLMGD